MDVGVVTTSFPRLAGDWAGRFVLDQAKALSARGHPVSVVAPDDPGALGVETMEGVEVRRVRYFAPRSMQCLAYGSGMPENVRANPACVVQLPLLLSALRRGAADLEADVLLAHWALAGSAAAPVARRRGLGLATTLNGSDLRLAGRMRLWRSMVRRALASSRRTFVVGETMAREVVRMGLAPESRVDVVTFGVEDELAERPVGAGEPGLVLFVGRLVSSKGVLELADAVGAIATGASGARLVCVGEGPLRERLASMPHVTCTGPLAREAVMSEVEKAALVVLASHAEGLPITLLEAMALARPVVATPVGCIPELLRVPGEAVGVASLAGVATDARRAGVLVPVGDAGELSRVLEELLDDASARAELGARARERIAGHYTWGRAAARLEDALARTAGEGGGTPG